MTKIKKTPIININTGEVIRERRINQAHRIALKARARKYLNELRWISMRDNDPQHLSLFLQEYGYSKKYMDYDWKNLPSRMQARFVKWYREEEGGQEHY